MGHAGLLRPQGRVVAHGTRSGNIELVNVAGRPAINSASCFYPNPPFLAVRRQRQGRQLPGRDPGDLVPKSRSIRAIENKKGEPSGPT
jgi:hypothetical protein